MSLECLSMLLRPIWFDSCDLQETIAVAWGDMGSIVIKLAIVDIFFMLWFIFKFRFDYIF